MSSERASSQPRPANAGPTAQVISLGELHGDAGHRSPSPVIDNVNPLHAVRARLQVCVGEVELSIGELLAAREHQVLVLNSAVDQPIDLMLEGRVIARGELVAVDGRFAVRISELPLPLKV